MKPVRNLVWISFNGCDKDQQNGWRWAKTMARSEWWFRRAAVMRRYTLPSLKRQTVEEFDVWAVFRPDDLLSPITKPVREALEDYHVRIVADCRDNIAQRWLEPAIEVRNAYRGQYSLVVMTRLDSDDIFAPDALECVGSARLSPGLVMGFLEGYIFDIASKRLALYHGTPRPMPFYSMVYTGDALLDERSWLAYRERWKMNVYHHQVATCPNWMPLPDGRFCITSNGTNTETTYDTATGRGLEITDSVVRQPILARFGLDSE